MVKPTADAIIRFQNGENRFKVHKCANHSFGSQGSKTTKGWKCRISSFLFHKINLTTFKYAFYEAEQFMWIQSYYLNRFLPGFFFSRFFVLHIFNVHQTKYICCFCQFSSVFIVMKTWKCAFVLVCVCVCFPRIPFEIFLEKIVKKQPALACLSTPSIFRRYIIFMGKF